VKKNFFKKKFFLLFFITLFISGIFFNCLAQQKDDVTSGNKNPLGVKEYVPGIKGHIESSPGVFYRAGDETWYFDLPVYTDITFLYTGARGEASFSINYIQELSAGEIYVEGRDENMSIKMGHFIEDWGKGVSISTISVFNPVDDRYPENIFFQRVQKPTPMLAFTVSRGELFQQVVFCNTGASKELLNDTLFGLRGSVLSENKSITFGFVRKLGLPPPLFFLTAQAFASGQKAWLELGWEYRKEFRDIWTFVIGAEKKLFASTIRAEWIVDAQNAFLFLEEIVDFRSSMNLNFKAFLHTTDFSSAYHGILIYQIDRGITLGPYFYLFLGKENKYFSPLRGENNSRVGLKFNVEF